MDNHKPISAANQRFVKHFLVHPLLHTHMSPLYALTHLRRETLSLLSTESNPVLRLALTQQFKNLTHLDTKERCKISHWRSVYVPHETKIRCGLRLDTAAVKRDEGHWSYLTEEEKKIRRQEKIKEQFTAFWGVAPTHAQVLVVQALGGWKKSFGSYDFVLKLPKEVVQVKKEQLQKLIYG